MRTLALLAGCLFGAASGQTPQGVPEPAALVECGSGQVCVFEGNSPEVLNRLRPRLPLQGEPKLTPDGRYAFLASKDGWLARYDLRDGSLTAQARAGSSLGDFAISYDGRWILAGNVEPHSLALFDAQLNLVRTYPSRTLDGKLSSPVSAVHDSGARKSFVVSFEAMPQLWEISYDAAAEPIFDGLVHDYRMGEAIAAAGFLGVRRIPLDEPALVFGFDATRRHVLATTRSRGRTGAETVDIINLDIRRKITTLSLRPEPSRQASTTFSRAGRPLIAVAAQREGVALVDPMGWRVTQTPAPASPLFVGTHANVRHLWVGSTGGKLTLIDKESLQVATVFEIQPADPVRIDFSRDGSRAWVGIRGQAGLLVYDTQTLAQVRRIEHDGGLGSLQCAGERCAVPPTPPTDPATPR